MRIEVRGVPELIRKLDALSDAVAADKLAGAVMAGALVVQNDAKVRAPYRTGNLRRSIHSELESATRTRAEVGVGTDVEYAPYVEFGTYKMAARPYLRPALDENEAAVEREIGDALRDLLLRAVG